MLVTLSGYIPNYVMTPISVHDIKATHELLEACKQLLIISDLDYLSNELKWSLGLERYYLWTRFFGTVPSFRLLGVQDTSLVRRLAWIQLRPEQIVLAHNSRYF